VSEPLAIEAAESLDLGDIVLRPWRDEDIPALCAALADPDIAAWSSLPQPFGPVEARAFVDESRSMWRDGSGAAFAVVYPDSGKLVGAVSRYGPDGHHASIGCWVVPEARGRGIGTRELKAVADRTFETTGTIRLEAFIIVGNDGSERMAKRAGFEREGVLRSFEMVDGQPVDCVAYSRIRPSAS
jgi:ribosomal-protein-alanine N-acetyltransferase